jgi:hypothetical protein
MEKKEFLFFTSLEPTKDEEYLGADFPLTLTFANEGNKTGIIDDVNIVGGSSNNVESIGGKRIEDKLPLYVKPHDCNHITIPMAFYIRKEIHEETPLSELEGTVKITWKRSIHKGIRKKMIEFENQSYEIKIRVSLPTPAVLLDDYEKK